MNRVLKITKVVLALTFAALGAAGAARAGATSPTTRSTRLPLSTTGLPKGSNLSMPKTLYVDESGDLGFGGASSSKYLTIVYVATENTPRLKVLVRRAQKRYGIPPKGEIKGTNLTQEQREDFLKRLGILPDIEIGAVVITKKNVYAHLRQKGKQNLLYAWAAGKVIIPYLTKYDNCHVIWDERTFKTRYGLTIDSYFSVQLAVKYKSGHNFKFDPQLSETRLGLQAADIVANTIWRKYENGDARAYPLVKAKIIDEFKPI